MTDKTTTETETKTVDSTPTSGAAVSAPPSAVKGSADPKKATGAPGGARTFQKNERPRRPRRGGKPRERREFDQKIISIRRVTRVVAGGRRFSFSVSIVIGDRKGKVGVFPISEKSWKDIGTWGEYLKQIDNS